MKPRLSSALSIVLLVVFSLSLAASADTAFAASACDAAQFVSDVTIPDGTYITAGSVFTKTWRLKNIGTCTWTTSYSLAFVSGEKLGGPDTVFFSRPVSPGQSVDITVTLTAPTGGGIYRGYWQFKNASGSLFGIGTSHESSFWVEIRVLGATQNVVSFDFVADMCSGQWIYDGGTISCPVNNSKKDLGYVLKLDNPILENGQAAGVPGLLTIPQNKYNGLIRGMFSPTDIFRGDHFQALVGCQYQATDCYVTFELEYELGGDFFTLWKTKEKYDGLYTSVDVDLTRIANLNNARIVLTVLASGQAGGDQPVWVAPRIVRAVSGGIVPPTSTVPTNTPVPTPSVGCNRAQYISDVTIPDGTTFAPNMTFTKTWRLQNVGSCTWTTGYSLVFASGDRMGGVDTLLPQTVVPGQIVDVGVNLTAPSVGGSYRGYWQLKDSTGALFGIGSTFDRPFYVDIKVSGSSSDGNTALDFVSSACSAQWFNGTNTLPCPGTDGDTRGFVLSLANPVLENGVADSRPGLLSFPQNINNGYIQGIYPTFAVQAGDRFQATLSCQYGATDCFVIYRVDAEMAGGVTQNMGTFAERYDGLYYPADIDLSSLAGKSVNFVLTVLSNGSPVGDRAMWVAPRIVRTLAIGGAGTPSSTPLPATDTPAPPPTNTPLPPPTDTPVPATPTDTPMPTATQ